MSRKRTGISELSPARWAYLKQDLLKLKGMNRYLHVSCRAEMVELPVDGVVRQVPFIERPGHTYRRPKAA